MFAKLTSARAPTAKKPKTKRSDGMKKPIQAGRAKCAKQDSEANAYQTLAKDPRATSDLLVLARGRIWKAIPESAVSRKTLQEHQAHNEAADEACSILLARARLNMELRGANWPTCQACPLFYDLTIQDVEGCPHAGTSSCPDKQHGGL
jgi:hypothetical protein